MYNITHSGILNKVSRNTVYLHTYIYIYTQVFSFVYSIFKMRKLHTLQLVAS